MSALDITILITGFVTVFAVFCVAIWVCYDSIKLAIEEPCLSHFITMVVINCMITFALCMVYVKYNEKKDSTEYQQYLDLKTKYEKGSK